MKRWTELLKLIEVKHTSVLYKVSDGVGEKNALETIAFYLENAL